MSEITRKQVISIMLNIEHKYGEIALKNEGVITKELVQNILKDIHDDLYCMIN